MSKTLTPGDIIIFRAEDDWLSKAIAWFTQSDASHAAMAYSADSIVEVGAYGIGVHNVEITKGDEIYVMRLKSQPDSAPLIARANDYLTAKVHYDFPALFILAGLLIYRRIIPTNKVLNLSSRILNSAGLLLDQMIQHAISHQDQRPMVCSQLVYQIFYDCGRNYRIQITDGCVWNSSLSEQVSGSIRLFDVLLKNKDFSNLSMQEILSSKKDFDTSKADCITQEEMEMLGKEFYTALCEAANQQSEIPVDLTEMKSTALSNTLSAAERFLAKVKYFMDLIHCDMPIDAMFVTPGDLVYHASNLEQVETLSLKRVHTS